MKILCIGDSNTWGYNPADGSRQKKRWTKILQSLCPDDEIIEEGLNGRTVISIDPQKRELCGIESLKMLLMSHKPIDLVIIMLGTNELKTTFSCRAGYIANGISEYIKIIKNPYIWEGFNVPNILIISPILLGENIAEKQGVYGDFDENSFIQSKYLGKAIEDVCRRYDVGFMNAADYAVPSEIDDIHMNEENHKKLAEAIFYYI